MKSPLAKAFGIVSFSQTVSNKSVRTLVAVLRSAFSMKGVYAWGVSTLHSFDGVFVFCFCWGHQALVRVGGVIWLGVVQNITEVLNPSIGLFTFGCNSATIFAFHLGGVIRIITTEAFVDLTDSVQFTLAAEHSASDASPSTKELLSVLALFFTYLSLTS